MGKQRINTTRAAAELHAARVPRRLRMLMGDRRISYSELSRRTGIRRATLTSKLKGEKAFTVPEVFAVALAVDQSWEWVLTGMTHRAPATDPPCSSRRPRIPPSKRWLV